MENKKSITEFIPSSPGRISMSKLAELLEVSERDVRRIVLSERLNGELIGSDGDGYYIPSTIDELSVYYRLARSRAMTCLKSLKTTRRRLKENGVNLSVIEGRSR